MGTEMKKVSGLLLDIGSKQLCEEIELEITLTQTSNANGYPEITILAITNGFKPDLNGKSFLLKLQNIIEGKVGFNSKGVTEDTRTTFEIEFQDSLWLDPAWFKML